MQIGDLLKAFASISDALYFLGNTPKILLNPPCTHHPCFRSQEQKIGEDGCSRQMTGRGRVERGGREGEPATEELEGGGAW